MKWANEHVVVLIAHNELGHEPIDGKDYDGKPIRACPLYPGLTCRDHVDASVDVDSARDEDLVRVPFIELCPNSWLVPPVGEPIRIVEEDQFVPAKIEKQVTALQKEHGAILSKKAFGQIRNALQAADAALDDDEAHAALEALKGIEKHAPKPHKALQALIAARLEAAAEPVGWAFEDLRDGDEPLAPRRKAVAALVERLDVAVYGEKVPLLAEMQAWLTK